MRLHVSLSLAAMCLLEGVTAGPVPGSPSVWVRNGSYTGIHNAYYSQDLFLGIPYAQPPVGGLRFKGPLPLSTTWMGSRNATAYSDVCMQYTTPPSQPMSEDCLTLNIVRPGKLNDSLLPVAVWIHGGGLYSGSSADTSYNLSNIVRKSEQAGKPIIGVSLNYRLTAFGFLWGSPELYRNGSANNGLRDQRLALHWLRENIAAFGGDATKITIWGQSSGGLSVGKQLVAYNGRDDGLFRAAIMESGSMVEKWPYNTNNATAYAEGLYRNLTDRANCTGASSPLECLRHLPIVSLSDSLNTTDTEVYPGSGIGPWLTVEDGDFLIGSPSAALRDGRFVRVPILYGTTTDESTGFGPGSVNTDAEFASMIAAGGPDYATIGMLSVLYPNNNAIGLPAGYSPPVNDTAHGLQYKRTTAFVTDAVETAPRRAVIEAWTKHGGKSYSYRWNAVPLSTSAAAGVGHASEIPFVFNNVQSDSYGSKDLQDLSTLASRMWASFIHDLTPNNHGLDGYPIWPQWDSSITGVGSNFVFDANVTSYIEPDSYRLAQTSFINSVYESQMKD